MEKLVVYFICEIVVVLEGRAACWIFLPRVLAFLIYSAQEESLLTHRSLHAPSSAHPLHARFHRRPHRLPDLRASVGN
jgi:hypothetical protein